MSIPTLFCDWAQFLANVATFLGVPIAIFIFLRDKARDRKSRELSTYSTVNSAFVDYLKLCLEHPHLSSAGYEAVVKDQSHAERDQELLIHMAVCMLESAYFLYREHDSDFRTAQWDGWNDYMKLWCQNAEFRKRWPGVIERYDRGFVEHMRKLYEEASEEIKRSNMAVKGTRRTQAV